MNAPIEEPLRITGPHFLDEHNIIQIPTNRGHLTVVACAAAAGINPKALYTRLIRTKDAWKREDMLAKHQANAGGGYRADDALIKAACKDLGPRRDAQTMKVGTWERCNL